MNLTDRLNQPLYNLEIGNDGVSWEERARRLVAVSGVSVNAQDLKNYTVGEGPRQYSFTDRLNAHETLLAGASPWKAAYYYDIAKAGNHETVKTSRKRPVVRTDIPRRYVSEGYNKRIADFVGAQGRFEPTEMEVSNIQNIIAIDMVYSALFWGVSREVRQQYEEAINLWLSHILAEPSDKRPHQIETMQEIWDSTRNLVVFNRFLHQTNLRSTDVLKDKNPSARFIATFDPYLNVAREWWCKMIYNSGGKHTALDISLLRNFVKGQGPVWGEEMTLASGIPIEVHLRSIHLRALTMDVSMRYAE